MIFYYINNSDRSSDVTVDSLTITSQIQQRSDNCVFEVFRNSKPTEHQDLRIYDGDYISSIASNVITVQGKYQMNVNKFRAGQILWLRLNNTNSEKVTVQSYNETAKQITLVVAPAITVSSGDQFGELVFGGTVATVRDKNLHSLSNIVYAVTGVDYSKLFDKKIVSDSWANVDTRYIINDFCNTTVNYNATLDTLSYPSSGSIQAVVTQALDGNAPTANLSDFIESVSSGVFGWTHSGGVAKWEFNFTTKDISDLLGVLTGAPAKGRLMIWPKFADLTKVTNLQVRVGSSSTNHAVVTLVPTINGDWGYLTGKMISAVITGNPNWQLARYAAIIVNETASSSVKLNGLRINDDSSFTLYNVQPSVNIDDYRSAQLKPTDLTNRLAKAFEFVWFIDYERDVHFLQKENTVSPYDITDASNNFYDLQVDVDASNIGNRIIVNGGEMHSSSTYAQVFQGDSVLRTWLLKSKFANLSIKVDNGTGTKTTEATTGTTTVKITGHGFSVGDHVVNRTRSNAVRQILTVADANTYTVEAVTSQASGDTISYFSVFPTSGVEGLDDETLYGYMYNSNEKSVRASTQTTVLPSGTFIRFSYNERLDIQIQYTNTASANALKALGLGDGIFDLDSYNDANITDLTTALLVAQAKTAEFSNPIINGTFRTDQRGLRAGQLLNINQNTNRALNTTYLIQRVTASQKGGQYQDYVEYSVTFGTTLFGWIEFAQKLLRSGSGVSLDVSQIVETFVASDETIITPDVNDTVLNGGFLSTKNTETPTAHDTNVAVLTNIPWHWEQSVGQTLKTRWDLFEWN